jgi:hypothetical protein
LRACDRLRRDGLAEEGVEGVVNVSAVGVDDSILTAGTGGARPFLRFVLVEDDPLWLGATDSVTGTLGGAAGALISGLARADVADEAGVLVDPVPSRPPRPPPRARVRAPRVAVVLAGVGVLAGLRQLSSSVPGALRVADMAISLWIRQF